MKAEIRETRSGIQRLFPSGIVKRKIPYITSKKAFLRRRIAWRSDKAFRGSQAAILPETITGRNKYRLRKYERFYTVSGTVNAGTRSEDTLYKLNHIALKAAVGETRYRRLVGLGRTLPGPILNLPLSSLNSSVPSNRLIKAEYMELNAAEKAHFVFSHSPPDKIKGRAYIMVVQSGYWPIDPKGKEILKRIRLGMDLPEKVVSEETVSVEAGMFNMLKKYWIPLSIAGVGLYWFYGRKKKSNKMEKEMA